MNGWVDGLHGAEQCGAVHVKQVLTRKAGVEMGEFWHWHAKA